MHAAPPENPAASPHRRYSRPVCSRSARRAGSPARKRQHDRRFSVIGRQRRRAQPSIAARVRCRSPLPVCCDAGDTHHYTMSASAESATNTHGTDLSAHGAPVPVPVPVPVSGALADARRRLEVPTLAATARALGSSVPAVRTASGSRPNTTAVYARSHLADHPASARHTYRSTPRSAFRVGRFTAFFTLVSPRSPAAYGRNARRPPIALAGRLRRSRRSHRRMTVGIPRRFRSG